MGDGPPGFGCKNYRPQRMKGEIGSWGAKKARKKRWGQIVGSKHALYGKILGKGAETLTQRKGTKGKSFPITTPKKRRAKRRTPKKYQIGGRMQ